MASGGNPYGAFSDYQKHNRRSLPFSNESNKFTLSDALNAPYQAADVALVSWVDSAEIAPLIEEISI